jgi:hypothetical protein
VSFAVLQLSPRVVDLPGRADILPEGWSAVPRLIPVSLDPDPVIEAYKKDVDRTLLRENLKLTPDERVRKMVSVLRFAEEVRRSGREVQRR